VVVEAAEAVVTVVAGVVDVDSETVVDGVAVAAAVGTVVVEVVDADVVLPEAVLAPEELPLSKAGRRPSIEREDFIHAHPLASWFTHLWHYVLLRTSVALYMFHAHKNSAMQITQITSFIRLIRQRFRAN